MTDQVNIVIQVTSKFIVDAVDSTARVANKLTLRHFVFDVRTRQVNGEHYQRKTNDIDSIYSRIHNIHMPGKWIFFDSLCNVVCTCKIK